MNQGAEQIAHSIAHSIAQEIGMPWGRLKEIVLKAVRPVEGDLEGEGKKVMIRETDWFDVKGGGPMLSGARYAKLVRDEKVVKSLRVAVEAAEAAGLETLSLQLTQEILRIT